MNQQQPAQHPQQPFAPNPYYDPYAVLRNLASYYNPNQMQAQQPPPPQPKADFVYRPVSSIEEARAVQIDWDGTVYFFEDKSTGQIYRKQYVNDAVTFTAYGVIEIPEPPKPDYVTQEALALLLAEIEDLKKRIPAPEDVSSNTKHGGFKK